MCISRPSAPPPPPPPPPAPPPPPELQEPKQVDQGAQEARSRQVQAQRRSKGRASTILGGEDRGEATLGKRTLLGGSSSGQTGG